MSGLFGGGGGGDWILSLRLPDHLLGWLIAALLPGPVPSVAVPQPLSPQPYYHLGAGCTEVQPTTGEAREGGGEKISNHRNHCPIIHSLAVSPFEIIALYHK